MGLTTGIEWTDATWTPIRARVKQDAAEIAQRNGWVSLHELLTATKKDGVTLRVPPGKVGPHCEHASPECLNCYSETNGERCLPANGTGLPFDRRSRDLVETFVDEEMLKLPLRWKKPKKIFVCSQTDLFGEWVPDEMIYAVWAVMALASWHTFQVLTKRAKRMRELLSHPEFAAFVRHVLNEWADVEKITQEQCVRACAAIGDGVLPNLWLGISAGDQQRAEERIPELLETPAAVRFLSLEPLIGAIDIRRWLPLPRGPMLASKAPKHWSEFPWPEWVPAEVRGQIESFWREAYGRNPQQWIENSYGCYNHAPSFGESVRLRFGGERWVEGRYVHCWNNIGRVVEDDGSARVVSTCDYQRPVGISWVIVGGESGPGARPMNPEWAGSIRDACEVARVPFFFKQWGEWVPDQQNSAMAEAARAAAGPTQAIRVGKKRAGRLLDGREWSEMPEVRGV